MKNFLTRQSQEGLFTIRLKSEAGKFTLGQLLAINELAEKICAEND